MRGWYGNRQAHMLASKGIRSKIFNKRNKQKMIDEGTFSVYCSKPNLDKCVGYYMDEGFSVFYEKINDNLYTVWGYIVDKIDLETFKEWNKDNRLKMLMDKQKYRWYE